MPDELPRGLDLHRHVGKPEIHRLVFCDRLAEAGPLAGVGHRSIQCGARQAHRLRGDADATGLEIAQRDAVSRAFRAEQVGDRHFAILEQDLCRVGGMLAQLFLDARNHVAG